MAQNPFSVLRKLQYRGSSKLPVEPEFEHELIDPSLFLAQKTFVKITNKIGEGDRIGVSFYLPATFRNWLFSNNVSISSREALFFLGRAEGVAIDKARILVEEAGDNLKTYYVEIEQKMKDSEFKNQLRTNLGENILANILYEEWMFLVNHSWIVSRTRKSFRKLIEAGAVGVEVGERLINKLVNKTLKENKEELRRIDYFRAFAKWVAVSGTPMIALVEPISGAIASSAAGVFLFFDPS